MPGVAEFGAWRPFASATGGLPLPKVAESAVTDEALVLFVPETEGETFQAGEQSDRLDVPKQGLGFVTFFEVIVGNSRTQMMDVMKANVA